MIDHSENINPKILPVLHPLNIQEIITDSEIFSLVHFNGRKFLEDLTHLSVLIMIAINLGKGQILQLNKLIFATGK